MLLKASGYELEVLGASRSPFKYTDTVITIRARYPRIILSELNTHRALSKSSGSSRAIPTAKMLEQVRNDPAMPYRFGANQPGMQDKGGEHNEPIKVPDMLREAFDYWSRGLYTIDIVTDNMVCADPRYFWRFMAALNAEGSEAYSEAGYHKQISNRLTEAYQWMNTILSGTTFGRHHFLSLRDHEAADPTIAKLASMWNEMEQKVVYKRLSPGEWHLVYIAEDEKTLGLNTRLYLSTARCARVSYAPFDGNPSHEKELLRHDGLIKSDPPHMSPTEHPCVPREGRWGNFDGFKQYRQFIENGEAVWGH